MDKYGVFLLKFFNLVFFITRPSFVLLKLLGLGRIASTLLIFFFRRRLACMTGRHRRCVGSKDHIAKFASIFYSICWPGDSLECSGLRNYNNRFRPQGLRLSRIKAEEYAAYLLCHPGYGGEGFHERPDGPVKDYVYAGRVFAISASIFSVAFSTLILVFTSLTVVCLLILVRERHIISGIRDLFCPMYLGRNVL